MTERNIVRPGVELLKSGDECGLDPRHLSQDELAKLGFEPMSPLKALRLRCLDCCCFSPNEVKHCVSTNCPSWPFRMGTNPWRAPVSDERREAAREAARERFGWDRRIDASSSDASPG